MSHASWQFGDFGDKGLILVAPVNYDFIFVHVYPSLPSRPYHGH
jgi:hypothetical protein